MPDLPLATELSEQRKKRRRTESEGEDKDDTVEIREVLVPWEPKPRTDDGHPVYQGDVARNRETATALARAVCMPKDMVRLTAMDSKELRGTVISHTVRVSLSLFLWLSLFS